MRQSSGHRYGGATVNSRDSRFNRYLTSWRAAILALWVGMACWGLSSPVMSSPDDNVHVALLYCEAGEATCDQPMAPRPTPCFAFQPQVTADCLQQPPSLSTAGVAEGRYPGLFPTVLSPLVGESVEGTVLRVRLFNVTLAVVVMAIALRASLSVLRPAALLAFGATLVPLGMFIIPSTNPSSWAISGAAALWAPLLSLAKSGVTRWRLSAVIAASLMIVGSRNEGWVLVALAASVALAANWPRGRWLLLPTGLAVLGATAALLRRRAGLETATTDAYRGPWEAFLLALTTPADAVGGAAVFPAPLGWLDTPIPTVVGVLTVGVVGALVFTGLGAMDRGKARMMMVYLVLSSVIIVVGWNTQFPSALQPRFALPVVIVGVGLVLLPAGRHRLRWTRLQGLFLAGALAFANSLALLSLSLRFTVGAIVETTIEPSPPFPGPLDLLRAGSVNWSLTPVPPFMAWVIGSVAFAWFIGWVMVRSWTLDLQADKQSAADHTPPTSGTF